MHDREATQGIGEGQEEKRTKVNERKRHGIDLVIRAGGVVAATMIVVVLIMMTVISVDGGGWWLTLV
jgi:hypothetical protein